MPKVGGQHFDYTPEGKAKAKAKAKLTGQKVTYDYSGPEMKGNKPRVGRTTSSQRRNYA